MHADHFVMENLCISAERNLGSGHPLYPMISKPCKLNAGIIQTGIQARQGAGGGRTGSRWMAGHGLLAGRLADRLAGWPWQ